MEIGNSITVTGFVTQRKNLSGKSLDEIERLLGYSKMRLAAGVIIAALNRLPEQDEFHIAGYSQVASHHTDEQYGKNLQTKYDMKIVTRNLYKNEWGLTGQNQLIKVMPVIRHSAEMEKDKDHYYPPGSGVSQWKLTTPINATVIAVLINYPNDKFI